MKILKCAFAAVLWSLLALSCSQGLKHSSRSDGYSINAKETVAAQSKQEDTEDHSRAPLRRLESVTWDSVKHELKWDISRGERKSDGYRPHSSDRYEINMDRATMTFNGESRRFSEDEASNVRTLMDFVSKYAVESTVWWESGEGEPVDRKDAPVKPDKSRPETNPEDRSKSKTIRVVALHMPE